jgi:hypothetical protein
MLHLIMLIVVEPIQWTSTDLFFLSISDEKRKFCDINTWRTLPEMNRKQYVHFTPKRAWRYSKYFKVKKQNSQQGLLIDGEG